MRRCVLLCLTLTLVSACQGDDVTRPKLDPASSPSALISDGNHSAGNPDFFFLPPLVRDPKTLPGGAPNPLWNAGKSNTTLMPTVRICELDVSASARGVVDPAHPVTADTDCKPGGYDVTTRLTAANVSRGILDETDIDNALTRFLTHYSSFVEPYYHFGWKVPAGPVGTTTPPKFYRVEVFGGSKSLGILDIESVNNFTQLFNVQTSEFVPLTANLRVPINFRIEQYALCATPGSATCSSASGDISIAPLTVSTGTPNLSGISTTVGVTIPKQVATTTPTPVTVTVSSCPSLNPTVLDLPVFGDCTRVTTDPVLPRLVNPATIFICAVGVNASLFRGLSEAQEERVTLHRYDATGENAGVVALPHAHACTAGLPGGTASIKPSIGAMLAKLAHGEFKRAATEAVALIAPKPLYAAMFIDLGGGGLTEFFSDFQFALPAKMEIVEGTSGQTAPPGTVLSPTVKVTDLGGDPVAGAAVHFFSADPARAAGIIVTTGADGLASTPWSIGEGRNSFPASGRGIASPSVNGPRGASSEGDYIVDPFMPMQSHFDANFTGVPREATVGTGSVTFTATGSTPAEIIVFNDVNPFQDAALNDPANGGGNRALVRNLGNVTGTGPRTLGTGILMDDGHGSAFTSCFGPAALAIMRGDFPAIAFPSGGLANLPASIRVVILCLPTVAYSEAEISGLRQFAAEGGRIIYVGEYGRRSSTQPPYGGDGVINRENEFLAAMNTGARNIGQGVDCGYALLPAVSIRAHPLTLDVGSLTIACSSVLTLGATDQPLFYDTSNSLILAGVVKIDGAPSTFARAAAATAATTSPQPWIPTHDAAGNPLTP